MEEQLINCLDKNVECFNLKNLEFICKVTNVYDADTCRVVFFLNDKLIKYTLRLKGIDTPEIRPKSNKPNREQEIRFAKKARNRLIQLSTSVNIDLESDLSKSKLQKLIDEKKVFFDFLKGTERYKFDLGGNAVQLYDVVFKL